MANRIRFGPYALDLEALILERQGRVVPLRPKLVETLAALVQAAPRVLSKEDLMNRVWPDVTVVESSLTRNISELRSELESGCPGLEAIETLPKRGYRFALPVTEEPEPLGTTTEKRQGDPRRWFAIAAALTLITLGGWAVMRPGGEAVDPGQDAVDTVAAAAFRSGLALYESWTAEDIEAAAFHFERSTRAEPELWFGHHGSLMTQLAALLLSGSNDAGAKARLRATADRAVLYGPEIAVTHAGRGTVLLVTAWDWKGAAEEIEEGIRWNPENGMPYQRRALWKTLQGRFDEALLDYDRAIELRPDFDDGHLSRAFNEFCARRYDEAIAEVEGILPKTKKQEAAHRLLAAVYGAKGDWEAAGAAAEKAGFSAADRLGFRAWRLAEEGDEAGALAARARMLDLCGEGYCETALIDAALGDLDAAFASLEEGFRERHWKLLISCVDPRLAALHGDARWQELVDGVRAAK